MVDKIRAMELNDLESVMAIEKKSFKACWTFDAFVYEILVNEKARYYVYTSEKQVIGYVGYWALDDELHITNLAVTPMFRKRGIGQRLIEYVLEVGKKNMVKKITLEVRVSNINAIRLYEKLGFKKGDLLKDYYKIEDGIAMIYIIKGGNE